MSQRKFGEGISEVERHVILSAGAYTEEKQASYLSDEAIKYYHYVFPALEGMIQRTWESSDNLMVKIFDPTIIEREKTDENGKKITEKEARGYVEYSLFSLAFLETTTRQLRKMGLDAKQEIHKLFDKETNLARAIITPIRELQAVVLDNGTTEVGQEFSKIDNYNKHFYQFFSVVRKLYEGKISVEEIERHNISLLYKYILYNFPRTLYLADYYHELNRERILMRQGLNEFENWSSEFLKVFEKDFIEIITREEEAFLEAKEKIIGQKERIVTRLRTAVKLLEGFKGEKKKERGNQIKEIIAELKGVKND